MYLRVIWRVSFLLYNQPQLMSKPFVHPTADVSKDAILGENVKVWHQAQIREQAVLGANCIVGKNAYIDHHVSVGANTKIQNNASVFHGTTLEEGVFVGPFVCFANDHFPRAINPDGTLKKVDDWTVSKTLIKKGAAIGAHATILPGVTIGEWAMVGAGSVVTKDVPAYALVYGNPAQIHGKVKP
jgi:UDP-2-acetamido-3-amino-2,3-dideoxy-glucuronate N-acetyltransferase